MQKQKCLPTIELDELEDASSCIGSGSFGQCHTWYYPRFGVHVVEKVLADSSDSSVYQEAYYQQIFAHRRVPYLFGITTRKLEAFLANHGVCWKRFKVVDSSQATI